MATACSRVFATEELFEEILSFLPFKNLFYVRSVSKRWNVVINGSVTFQQKMFLRTRDQPELWVLERKHNVRGHYLKVTHSKLNDPELKFRRVEIPQDDKKSITPITLNPILEDDNKLHSHLSNALMLAMGCEIEVVTYRGWTDAFWDQGISHAANASFWDTFLTDPPCHRVEVEAIGLRLDDTAPPSQASTSHPNPIVATVDFPDSEPLTLQSISGARMRDVLLASLTARGNAHSYSRGHWSLKRRDTTIREAVEAAEKKAGSERISNKWGMFFRLHLYRVGDAQPLLATDEERAAANVDWK